ncbi:hypothetical protein IV203_001727 [Nitzschia inconspicua]|uniref:DUF6824 domain-containing protein n=1 Tax=Nitzschia inconspicua TaxID=303405 RepID=A0A9K3L862_9STRA|nr:hypothetical protein IV203_001727 [Nitzschia inconspicua]
MMRSSLENTIQTNTSPNAIKCTLPFSCEGKLDASYLRGLCDSGNAVELIDASADCEFPIKKRGNGPGEILPEDFVPSSYTVIVGRGKRIAHSVGNQRLRILANIFLPEYARAANCKAAKTRIVNKIVDTIKCACVDSRCEGAFVRHFKGRYYVVDDSVAREKVGYQLRDLLGDRYESSSRSKVAKKHRLKLQKRRKLLGDDVYDYGDEVVSYSSSSTGQSSHPRVISSYEYPLPVVGPNSSVNTLLESSSTSQQSRAAVPSRPRHLKNMSFDAMQLLKEPLITGRNSITWIEYDVTKSLQEVLQQQDV